MVCYIGAITEYSCTESDHRHHGEEREGSFQQNYHISFSASLWLAIEGPLLSTRAQSLTIGIMARKGTAFFSKPTICSSLWLAIEGPLPSTRAQSLTIGIMARKGKALFSKTIIFL